MNFTGVEWRGGKGARVGEKGGRGGGKVRGEAKWGGGGRRGGKVKGEAKGRGEVVERMRGEAKGRGEVVER